MRFKRLLGAALTLGVLVSTAAVPTGAFAAEKVVVEEASLKLETQQIAPEEDIPDESIKLTQFKPLSKQVQSFAENTIKRKKKLLAARSLSSNGADQYESNNSYDVATAGLKNQVVYASIHEENDVDWYSFTVSSDDITNQVPYACVLTNIPANCDYDMWVIKSDFSIGANNFQSGSTSEEMAFVLPSAGTYYVLIQSSQGYSTANYKLFFGNYYMRYYTGWINTSMSFSFADKAQGTSGYIYSNPDYQTLNLNNFPIPDNSIIKEFSLDSTHTGTWGGFEKCLIASSDNNAHWQLGGIDIFDFSGNNYNVKQIWGIKGRVNYCSSFVWTPRIALDFVFGVNADSLAYFG